MSQPATATEHTVINHSGVVPEPVDPLADVDLPTAGRGPTLMERIRGMVRGAGGSFNPRMIALGVGGVILALIALGLFVKQSPAKASTTNTGAMKPVEVKKDSTYKSAPPVQAAAKEGGEDHSSHEQSEPEEKQNISTEGPDTHTASYSTTESGSGLRQTHGSSSNNRVEGQSRSNAPVSASNDSGYSESSSGDDQAGKGRTLHARASARERHYAVDYEAPVAGAQKALADTKEDAVVLPSSFQSVPPVKTAPVQAEQGTVLPRGLRIKMELLDPFQSGLSAMVRARVLEDVRLKDGKLLVPYGSEVYLPMLELAVPTPDNKGRVVVNPKPSEDEMGFITIGEDSRIMLKGTAYGADNLAGLPGKRTKVDGQPKFSALKRLAGRASGALSSMSPVPLYGIESEIDRGSYSYERTQYIVNVPAHSRFVFVVGL